MSQKNKSQTVQLSGNESNLDFFRPLSLLIIVSSMAIAPFIFDAFVIPKILLLYLGLLSLGIYTLINRKRKVTFRRIPTWIIVLVTVLVVLIITSTYISQTSFLRAMFGQFGRGNGLFYYFGALGVFLLTAMSYSQTNEKQFTRAMTYLSIILGFYTFLQSVGIDFAKLDTKELSPVVLTLGNSNFAGGLLAMLFGFVFTRSFRSTKIDIKDLAISVLLLFGIYKTGAVQGYLIAIFVFFVIVSIRIVSITKNYIWKLTLYAFFGIVTLLVIIGLAGSGPVSRVFARSSFQMRIEYWKISFRILRDNLLVGIGPDQLYDVSPLYMTPGSLNLVTTTSLDSPHNWFLHFGSSFGLPSLILLLALILTPIIMFLRKASFNNFLSNNNSPTFMALLCLVIDGLVSIEQVGLGIWMYFFAGKILAPLLIKPGDESVLNLESALKKHLPVDKLVIVSMLIFTLLSSGVILDRFKNDALLRSAIQKVMLGSQSEFSYQKIENLAIKLKAEPEYVVQAVPILAKVGDGNALLNISKSYFDYNPNSRQATAIRFEVLKAVSSLEKACPLLPSLISSTPWVGIFVESFLLCVGNGFYEGDQKTLLVAVQEYINVSFPRSKDGAITNDDLLARSIYARLQFQLGRIEKAKLLKQKIETDLILYETNFPENDVSRIAPMLDF